MCCYAGKLLQQPVSNHWHFVLCPTEDGGMSQFLGWVTLTHTMRLHYGTSGEGHIYQGRFKKVSLSKTMNTFSRCVATLSEMHSGPPWWIVRKSGVGAPFPAGLESQSENRNCFPLGRSHGFRTGAIE